MSVDVEHVCCMGYGVYMLEGIWCMSVAMVMVQMCCMGNDVCMMQRIWCISVARDMVYVCSKGYGTSVLCEI